MTHKNYILATLLVLMAAYSYAGNRTVEQAQHAVQALLQRNAPRRVKGQTITVPVKPRLVATKQRGDNGAYYYVFSNGEGKGYTMVSGDDRLPEIVGHTSVGDWDAEAMPDGLRYFLDVYEDFTDNASAKQIAQVNAVKSTKRETILPLTKTGWGQHSPYNDACPLYNGERCLTGCTATAMAQILKYYNYPDKLKKSIPAYHTTWPPFIDLAGIDAGEEYEWDNMLDVYNGSNHQEWNDTNKAAVAKLMYHLGCATRANYGVSGTCAGIRDCYYAFVEYFGMDPELTNWLQRAGFTLQEWNDLLYSELHSQRPVLYAGYGPSQGHTFIIDGYEDGLYYVNWGSQNGRFAGDGTYDITVLSVYGAFNEMIFTQPDNGVEDRADVPWFKCNGFRASNVQECTVTDGIVSANAFVSMTSLCSHEVSRYVSIGYRETDGSIKNVGTPVLSTPAAMSPDFYPSVGNSGHVSFKAEEGQVYELIAIESDDAQTWMPCQQEDNGCSLVVKLVNGEVTLTNTTELSGGVTMSAYTGNNNIPNYRVLNITTRNTGDKEYYGYSYVYVSDTDTRPEMYYSRKGITVLKGDSTTYSFGYEFPGSKRLNVWVYAGLYDKENYEIFHTVLELGGAADPTAVSSAESSPSRLEVRGGRGRVSLHADEAVSVAIADAGGRRVRAVAMRAGESADIPLPPGVYAVGGRKVVVR